MDSGCTFMQRLHLAASAVAATIAIRVRPADDAPQAPEIQTMYNVPFPVSVIRTRIREEFERNRFVNKLPVVDVLLFKSDAEYQVKSRHGWCGKAARTGTTGLTVDDRKP